MTKPVSVLNELFHQELIFLDLPYQDLKSAIIFAGEQMTNLGLVEESFAESVLAREAILPTGLQLGDYGVAIPHTDASHIKQSAVSVLVFKEAIVVNSMIDPSKSISTKLVFLLAVREPDGQIEVLKELMNLFKDVEVLRVIEQSKDANKVLTLINKK